MRPNPYVRTSSLHWRALLTQTKQRIVRALFLYLVYSSLQLCDRDNYVSSYSQNVGTTTRKLRQNAMHYTDTYIQIRQVANPRYISIISDEAPPREENLILLSFILSLLVSIPISLEATRFGYPASRYSLNSTPYIGEQLIWRDHKHLFIHTNKVPLIISHGYSLQIVALWCGFTTLLDAAE